MSAAVRTASEINAAMALRLPFMRPSLASAFPRKTSAYAAFTFLTKRFPRVDHFAAYDAYIARRKETLNYETNRSRTLHHRRRHVRRRPGTAHDDEADGTRSRRDRRHPRPL